MFPRLFERGEFFIPTYGVLLAAAFLLALWLAARLGRQAGLDSNKVSDVGLVAAIGGIVGAKLGMYIFDWRYFAGNPGEIFALTTLQAAGVFQTGVLVALGAAVAWMRMRNIPVLKTCDVFAPGLAIGHAVGRIGCFAAGCCWGAEARLPWSVTFTDPFAHERFGTPLGVPLHPSQLYEAFAEAAIFVFLLDRLKRPHADGSVLGWYLVLYSVLRFLVEFVRFHDQGLVLGLSLTQWISLAMLVPGVWLLRRREAVPAAA
jgi:phosphatidylglycerol:prolipoprotein diacylglycerol transferase